MNKLIIIGLTGSIGTGKTTVSRFLKHAGFPVFDADGEVKKILQNDKSVLEKIYHHWPFCFTETKDLLNKKKLAHHVFSNPQALNTLESILHPQVQWYQEKFLEQFKNAPYVIIESPLLFETQVYKHCDWIVVTTCTRTLQKQRVLKRPGMTEALYEYINARQMPDLQKQKKAHYVIDTSPPLTELVKTIRALLQKCPLPKKGIQKRNEDNKAC